jgi:RNA polymerase sigma-70 factor (ECF subfamily)
MSSTEKLLEQVLILRCQLRDKDAFAELIERYQKPLRYFINRLLSNSELAEEAFQETWLTVIRQICSLRKPETFAAWLYRIAHSRVYQELRRKKLLSNLNENLPAANVTEDDSDLFEDIEKLHRCLDKLRPEHKEVLMLRFLEQMSHEQIADVIDCNPGTVKSRIYYAKLALKKEMEK